MQIYVMPDWINLTLQILSTIVLIAIVWLVIKSLRKR
ncbi:Uncharacterised protein [Turicibacter sanguinis]|nr:Uncharacterised protein [Turicibacter sanguinis]